MNVVVADSTQIPSAWGSASSSTATAWRSPARASIDKVFNSSRDGPRISLPDSSTFRVMSRRLKEATGRELDRLDSGLVTITTQTDEIAITRTVTARSKRPPQLDRCSSRAILVLARPSHFTTWHDRY